jgi:mono/diheme cytochrome c family protein
VSNGRNIRNLGSADRCTIYRKRRVYGGTGKKRRRAFQAKCAGCHGEDLHSTDAEAPDLTEGAFKFGWQGKTLANRFEQIRGTMPLGNARGLDDQTYIDIVAYILQFNGMPSGSQKLEPDTHALEQIVVAIP